jgi:metal transporter CNNM
MIVRHALERLVTVGIVQLLVVLSRDEQLQAAAPSQQYRVQEQLYSDSSRVVVQQAQQLERFLLRRQSHPQQEQVEEAEEFLIHNQSYHSTDSLFQNSSIINSFINETPRFLQVLPVIDDSSNNNNEQEDNNSSWYSSPLYTKNGGWVYIVFNSVGSIICVCLFAIISGLFLGFLTLDTIDLQIIQRSSLDEDERLYATTLLPLVKRRHQILVTLELMSALAYETLPIFLDALVPSWVAILLSVTIVMVFGEIIPSGIFMGPNQLYLGYHMVPLMSFLLWIFHPLATPLVKLLDYLTDTDEDDTDPYSRDELSALVRIQHEAELDTYTQHHHHPSHHPSSLHPRVGSCGPQQRLSRSMKHDRRKDQTWRALKEELLERVQEKQEANPKLFPPDLYCEDEIADRFSLQLHPREVSMVEGALQMKTVHAMDVYTPLSTCFCVPDNLILDKMNITTIYGHGFSRVPVYRVNPDDEEDTSHIIGFFITRQLMVIDWDDLRIVSTLPLQRPTCVSPRMNLIDLFELLQKDGRMLTFVCARPDLANKALKCELPIPVEAGLMGIITLVDIMESIIQDRIYDEGDIRDRDRAVATLTRWAATIVVKFMRRSAAVKRLERQRTLSHNTDTNNTIFQNYQDHSSCTDNSGEIHTNGTNGNGNTNSNGTHNNRYQQYVQFDRQSVIDEEEALPLLRETAVSATTTTTTSATLPGPALVCVKKPKLRNRFFMSNR